MDAFLTTNTLSLNPSVIAEKLPEARRSYVLGMRFMLAGPAAAATGGQVHVFQQPIIAGVFHFILLCRVIALKSLFFFFLFFAGDRCAVRRRDAHQRPCQTSLYCGCWHAAAGGARSVGG